MRSKHNQAGNFKGKLVIFLFVLSGFYEEHLCEQFYQELSSIINAVPANNLFLIGGDFKAQSGPLDALFTYNDETNRNDKHKKDQMEQLSLDTTNTS